MKTYKKLFIFLFSAIIFLVSFGSARADNFGLNISNLSLSAGNSITLSSANYANLYVASNSNPNVASITPSSFIPGCTANYQYSITTGQPCVYSSYSSYSSYYPYNYNYYGNSNGTVTIYALSAGSDTITLCQNNGNACNSIYITVTGGYYSPAYSSIYSNVYSPVVPISTDVSTSGIPIIYSSSYAY